MDIDPQLLKKYWSGECTAAEKDQVEHWLKADEPLNKYQIKANANKDSLKEELWSAISERRGLDIPSSGNEQQPFPIRRSLFIAASLLAFIIVSLILNRSTKPDRVAIHKITVPYGKQMSVVLADGTEVMLNSGTEFTYPETFGSDIRKVRIIGEGYFHVTRNKDKPFIVETLHSSTKVIGTKFNLKEFRADDQAKVTLQEGSVEFSAKLNSRSIVLVPNEQAIVKDGTISRKAVNVQLDLGWKEGMLSFDDVPFKEALREIERHYNVVISVQDPLLNKLKIRGSFKLMALGQLLEEIAYLLNIKYRVQGRNIIIY